MKRFPPNRWRRSSGNSAVPMRCAADPSVETYLRCGRCEKPICPRCLIQTPVGARCRDCAQLRKLPMFDVRPLDYLRAIAGGVAAAVVGELAFMLVQNALPLFSRGIFGIALLAAIGYGVGTAVAYSTRRKQGNGLGIVAAISVPLGMALARAAFVILAGAPPLVAIGFGFASLFGSAWVLLGIVLAMGIAYSRAR